MSEIGILTLAFHLLTIAFIVLCFGVVRLSNRVSELSRRSIDRPGMEGRMGLYGRSPALDGLGKVNALPPDRTAPDEP